MYVFDMTMQHIYTRYMVVASALKLFGQFVYSNKVLSNHSYLLVSSTPVFQILLFSVFCFLNNGRAWWKGAKVTNPIFKSLYKSLALFAVTAHKNCNFLFW